MWNAVGWFEIYVEDMERARGFYEAVFQVKLEKLPVPDIEMLNFPIDDEGKGSSGALVRMPGLKPGVGGTLVYFTSQDCSVEESRVEQAGGRIERPRMSIGPYGFISLVYDTEGNMIGIHSQK
ncbi:MAG: VOC family protein [Pyrinomonadaceae bacterium]